MWLQWMTVWLTGSALFLLGTWIARAIPVKWFPGALAVGAVLAVPGLLFAAYYLHLFDDWLAFIEFRALPGTEFLGAAAGLFAGLIHQWVRRTFRASAWGLPLLFLLGASIPFVKPSIASLDGLEILDRWEHDVCLQSTASTCGPAAAATILRSFGVNTTEAELASAAYTSASGTEVWYLIRELRRLGFTVRPRTGIRTLDQVTPPAIAGVRNTSTGTGHFIALVRRDANHWFAGDPLTGGATYAMEDATNLFTFTGFFVEVSRPTH